MLNLQKEYQDQLAQDLEPQLLGPAKYKIRLSSYFLQQWKPIIS